MSQMVNCGEHPEVFNREVGSGYWVSMPSGNHPRAVQLLEGEGKGIPWLVMDVFQLNNFTRFEYQTTPLRALRIKLLQQLVS